MDKILIELYPDFMHCKTLKEILKQEGIILEEEEEDINNLLKEFFIETATFSLPTWAEFAGVEDNVELDIDIRRSNVKAALQTKEATTVEVIKNVAESYSNGTCEVTENIDDYSFVIRFIGTMGVPVKISEMEKIINKIKPAHLNYKFEFKYRTWGDLEALGKTWKYYEDRGYTWKDLRERSVL